jgi:hypothetical protein
MAEDFWGGMNTLNRMTTHIYTFVFAFLCVVVRANNFEYAVLDKDFVFGASTASYQIEGSVHTRSKVKRS